MEVFLATLKGPSLSWIRQQSENLQTSGPQSERIKRCLDGGLRSPSASILVAILLLLNGAARSRRLGTKYNVGFADD